MITLTSFPSRKGMKRENKIIEIYKKDHRPGTGRGTSTPGRSSSGGWLRASSTHRSRL